MQRVGAGLGADVQIAAWAAAGFALAVGLERVLIERVYGIYDAGDAADTALVDCVRVEVQIVVVCSVDGVVDLIAAHTVHRTVVADAGERG